MKISIAMATYNGGSFLEEQLESISSQTRPPDEIIICDDGSTDESLEIIKKFENKVDFNLYLENNLENLGPAKNFEKAISLCSGDIIFLSDQDDSWNENKIEFMVKELLSSGGSLAVSCDCWIGNREGIPIEGTFGQRQTAFRTSKYKTRPGACTAIRGEARKILLPIPPGIAHDMWINLLFKTIGSITYLDKPLQTWRRHDANSSQGDVPDVNLERKQEFLLKNWSRNSLCSCEKRIFRLKKLEERIKNCEKEITLIKKRKNNLCDAHNKIQKERRRVEERVQVLKNKGASRVYRALKAYGKGCYSDFSGLKSLLKDILVTK